MEQTPAELPCLYFAVDDAGVLMEVNRRLCQQLGYSREELTGQKLDSIYTVSSRIFYETHLFPLLKLQGLAAEIYLTLQTKEKQALPVLINAERTEHGNSAVNKFAGIVVHNRKKFEEELVAARKAAETAATENTELIEARKIMQLHAEQLDRQMQLVQRHNEELTLFNRVVTHDLQEPLRKLLMFTNMLQEVEDEEGRNKTAGRIAAAGKQLRSIVTGLQQYVWLTDAPLKLTALDLNELLKNAADKISQQSPDLIVTIDFEELPTIYADPEQLGFFFEEVICNAVRFRKPGNEVRIAVSASRLLQNQFRTVPGKYKYVDYLKLDISDEGIGMNTEYKNQALELFKRLHPNSGRGVGLSLCKKIVENHGGSMLLHTKEDKGTTVTVWLPFLEEQPNPAPAEKLDSQKINP